MITSVKAHVALGSNWGNREIFLNLARERLKCICLGDWRESRIYESEPLGAPNQGPYLNQVVSFSTDFAPLRLLHYCKGVEWILGRQNRGRWTAREIDLDVLCWGGVSCRHDSLRLPHPCMHKRLFVLDPLYEISPQWRHPQIGKSVQELREICRNGGSN